MAAEAEDPPFHIVGVGASAGGLEALEQFFGAMPEDSGMAFVVVQHLSPDFKSVMDELLSRRTKLPVLLVEDGIRVQPNRVYLIPPKKEMIISAGRLLLSDKGAAAELTLPVDTFFRSLAQDVGDRAIGVVLSGAGTDGARGIRDIHDAGGLVLCQDAGTAVFDGMPRSARDTGVVDYVLSPPEMAAALIEHATYPANRNLGEPFGATPLSANGVGAALRQLQETYGIDFSHYKPSTVVRRIERRLQLNQCASLDAYVEKLANSEELDALFRDLLIGVTRFFRDQPAFQRLEQQIIPELLARTPAADELRIWIAGCATGEEPYSIAMLLQEQLRLRKEHRRVKILATDLHRGSLDFASRGLYGEDRVADVRPELLARYFDKRGPNYQISPELRQLIVFAPHNVVRDAPFTRLDLVSCRNLLIYLQPLAQKKVLSLLHFALKRHGILFLGPSENIGALSDDFESVDAHWRLYRKHRDVRVPSVGRVVAPSRRVGAGSHAEAPPAAGYSLSQVINVYDALLDEHMPPSLLVNERRELIHAFGGAGRFLRVPDGRTSLDVFDMVAPDLKAALTGAMSRALKEHATIVYTGLPLSIEQESRSYRLAVKPVVSPGAPHRHVLVTLVPEQLGEPRESEARESAVDLERISHEQLTSLEAELRRTKESLQATIEELETSNEELQATNEELLASNEELQSTNEELQSVNEELYTVNAEYQKKIAELTELTNDMDNLLASIQVGTIFLDRQLCIRKFTPLVAELFNLLPQDIGRAIAGFSNSLDHPRMMDELATVLQSGKSIETEVNDRAGNWFFLRILPYLTRGAIDGVVLTLIDINGLKAAEDAVFRERYLLNSLMDSVPDVIYFKDALGRFVRVNQAMATRLGLKSSAQATGKSMTDFASDPDVLAAELLDQRAIAGEAQPFRQEQNSVPNAANSWFMTTRQPLRDGDGDLVGMLKVARDVTDQKRAEDEIRLAIKRRDEFLAMLSHELRNPLAAIVNATVLLQGAQDAAGSRGRALEVIERQSRQMTRLLDDLLEVSRITQNKIELRKQPVDARTVVNEAVLALRERFSVREVTLAVQLDPEPVWVEADPARLQQILVNLLDNASKYNRPGGHVELELSRLGGEARVCVRDDGVGIEPALVDSIFEPFVQGRTTLHRTEGGMGVGLSLVRSLVEMHGGRVSASSAGPDQGCVFAAFFPLTEKRVAHVTPSAPHNETRWPAARRVVVVEDNPDGAQMLELLLQQAGCEVFVANDGQSGVALIGREKPDIAIVDIGLPVLNGFEVARQVRAQPEGEKLYLVALTGYGQAEDQAKARDAGFDEHLVKPLDPEELTRLMARGSHASA